MKYRIKSWEQLCSAGRYDENFKSIESPTDVGTFNEKMRYLCGTELKENKCQSIWDVTEMRDWWISPWMIEEVPETTKDETMKTIEEKIEVMQAYKEGKRIESQPIESDNWVVNNSPRWNWAAMEYRVTANSAQLTLTELIEQGALFLYHPEGDRFTISEIADNCIICVGRSLTSSASAKTLTVTAMINRGYTWSDATGVKRTFYRLEA